MVQTWLDDAEFGRRFVGRAVTAPRIEAALATLVATTLRLGTYPSGPLGLAQVGGEIGFGPATVRGNGPGRFAVSLPAALRFAVGVGIETRVEAEADIALVLTPRPADPLLLVIDVSPVQPGDVRTTLRGAGLAAPVTAVVNPLLDELRGYLAATVNGVLNSDRVRAARTIDLGAHIDGTRTVLAPGAWTWLDDAEFGRRLLQRAVTERRLADGFGRLVGEPISVGPIGAGPRDLARVQAGGAVRSAVVGASSRRGVAYTVIVSLGLDIAVAAGRRHDYHADITVPLDVTPRAADPLVIVVDIAPLAARSVDVTLDARGAGARLVGRAARLSGQLRRRVATAVDERVAASTARIIDVGARLDAAGLAAEHARVSSERRRPRPYADPDDPRS